ncbi:MAG: hypothetical protein RLZZ09_1378, partial [Pseudomonadota bacterium]
MQALTFAYWANIVILAPIAVPTIFRIFPTDEGRMEESSGWRVLVGSLWTAILALSILGLFAPERYAPVLLLQFVYKTIWLLVYAAPRLLRREYASIPWGIVVSFAAIAVVWPFIIPWSALFAEPDEKALGSCSAERRQIAS